MTAEQQGVRAATYFWPGSEAPIKDKRPTYWKRYDVDSKGHSFGPCSPEVVDAIKQVDGYLGRLSEGIAARGLQEKINLILVFDHGMVETDQDRLIFLDDYVDERTTT